MSWFRKRKPTADSGGDALLARLDGKQLVYVSRREPDDTGTVTERVLGKNGRLNTLNGRITISCDGKIVFCCDSADATFGELMNLSGVLITGTDGSGERQTVVAYYQYYR